MKNDLLINVEGVSKKFCRDLKRSLWYGVQDTVADLLGRDGASIGLRQDEFWAVDNVSFELRRGECLGLIGRNGAGKTTLLKMLNGLIKPDRGRIEMRGRVGALIALGAGFNPILTGRENIYVNGAVLGLSKREIDAKYDEIVGFAEIGDFVSAPVQSYSSGMQVRLGFAVATALQPDVLLLDEVLAVGDAAFRAKCYQRIAEIRSNAALILVSHNMEQIAQACSSVVVLAGGRLVHNGAIERGIERYNDLPMNGHEIAPGVEHVAACVAIEFRCPDHKIHQSGSLRFSLAGHALKHIDSVDLKVVLWGPDGLPALDSYTRAQGNAIELQEGKLELDCAVGPLSMKAGRYALSVALIDRANNDHLYWGDRIKHVEICGPATGVAHFTPPCTVTVR